MEEDIIIDENDKEYLFYKPIINYDYSDILVFYYIVGKM